MEWEKISRIFTCEKSHKFFKSHASLPVPILINEETVRIYFSSRDIKGRSYLRCIDVLPEKPSKIIKVYQDTLLELGKQGTFDDNGIMPSSIVKNDGLYYLYYIGWNPQVTVSYRLSIGLAVSKNGLDFTKYSEGPILDRDLTEPFFNTAPYVIKEGNKWHMWYVSCTGWTNYAQHPEPYYLIKHAESSDGIHWVRTNRVCIDYDNFTKAIGKPCVFTEGGEYIMLYSYRNHRNYRTDPNCSYRLGLARSSNGLEWVREDNKLKGLGFSNKGWDSQMMEYCSTYTYQGKRYLIYNGNGFGATGFGYAIQR